MRINWKLRLQNKTTLAALLASVTGLAYLVLELFGVVPCITESETTAITAAVLNLLVLLGVLVDPTTKGVQDSDRALHYDCPACNCDPPGPGGQPRQKL